MAISKGASREYLWVWGLTLLVAVGAVGAGDWYVCAWGVLLLVVYEHLLRPLPCGASTQQRRPCRNNTRGRWRGCRYESHQRAKRDVVYSALLGHGPRPIGERDTASAAMESAPRPGPPLTDFFTPSSPYTRAVVGTALASLLVAVVGSLWNAG